MIISGLYKHFFKGKSVAPLIILACFGFLVAAVVSWDVPVKSLLVYAVYCVVGLLGILIIAASLGWLLSKLRS